MYRVYTHQTKIFDLVIFTPSLHTHRYKKSHIFSSSWPKASNIAHPLNKNTGCKKIRNIVQSTKNPSAF